MTCCESSRIDGLTFCLYCNANLANAKYDTSLALREDDYVTERSRRRREKKRLYKKELCFEIIEKLFLPPKYTEECDKLLNFLLPLKNYNTTEEQCVAIVFFLMEDKEKTASFHSLTDICLRFGVCEKKVWNAADYLNSVIYPGGKKREAVENPAYYHSPIRKVLTRLMEMEAFSRYTKRDLFSLEMEMAEKCFMLNEFLSYLPIPTIVAASVQICCKSRSLQISLKNVASCTKTSPTTIKRTVKAFFQLLKTRKGN